MGASQVCWLIKRERLAKLPPMNLASSKLAKDKNLAKIPSVGLKIFCTLLMLNVTVEPVPPSPLVSPYSIKVGSKRLPVNAAPRMNQAKDTSPFLTHDLNWK